MTLVQLRHLVSLAATGSFSASARALHLTQPALSRSIRSLEDELGGRLFDRIGRISELTSFGKEVLRRARHLVSDADELGETGRRLRQFETGELRIGMGSSPGALLTTPLLMLMATQYPKMRVEVSRGQTDRLLHGLRARTLDALVVDAHSLSMGPDLQLEMVREMRGAFMCRPGHPLAQRRGALRFDDLRGYPIASTSLSNHAAGRLVQAHGLLAHPEAAITVQCEELSSLVEVARRSDTILLAVRAAAPDLAPLDVRPSPTGGRYALVTLARRTQAPALEILRGLIDEVMTEREI